jgi:hypothetical protein
MRIRKIHDLEDLRAPELAEAGCLHHSLRSRLRVSRVLPYDSLPNLACRARAQRHERVGLSGRPSPAVRRGPDGNIT